ncbi:hypothetical protein V496_08323 [Pseudogymnoascus sp. VKM F-4515 (FW-2607)]|nr:hypothetical protein V496_08323 [Pseudogymnoascus sp. VKM F-4515 (FW-2607)]
MVFLRHRYESMARMTNIVKPLHMVHQKRCRVWNRGNVGALGISLLPDGLVATYGLEFSTASTERTHEENQERAYIAASRRSDRSLEARVESARRASEIHKRRTGRSLRVSEEDVINEEMYEEEEDDLPHQYRCLTAHLHSQSTDFNHVFSDYLTNHIGMRSALEEALRDSYATQAAQQAGRVPGPYPSVAGMMNAQAQLNYQAQMLESNHPPYAIHNALAGMPIAAMPQPSAYLQQQQLPYFDPQLRNTQSLQNQRQHNNQCHAESTMKCQQSAAVKSPSPDTSKPNRGNSMPVEIKSESPALQSIEQPQTPVSRSYEPRPQPKRPGPADFNATDSSLSTGASCDKTCMPQVNVQAADSEFNPFATATPQDEGIFNANIGFPNDPLMDMFMAGNEALNVPPSYDSSLNTSYSGTPAVKLELGTKTHVGGLDSTVGGGIAPAQLESASVKKGLDVISGVPARLKGSAAGTASTSATGTLGIAPDKWNEWIESGEWEGGVQ